MRASRRGASRPQDGAAVVEFALVVPLLLAILCGVISYGYMLSFRQAMSQGAAEGARAAAVWAAAYTTAQDAERTAAARAAIGQATDSYGVDCDSGATCTVTIVPCATARCVRVTVTYPYGTDPLTPQLPFVPMPDTLSYTAEARVS